MADWSNKEFVLATVAIDGYNLEYASDNLKDDKEVVLIAVTENGDALGYASDNLKNDKEIVLAAVTADSWALQFANQDLRNDVYFLYEVNKLCTIEINCYVFKFLNEEIRTGIRENPDYLLDFEFAPVYLKPCKK
jgi:hypothetical protein